MYYLKKHLSNTFMNDNLPSYENVVHMLKNAINRIEKLENEITILKQHMNRKVRKIDIVSHLNTNYTKDTLFVYKWIDSLPYDMYLEHAISYGIESTLRKMFSETADSCPVRITQINTNYCYVYTEEKGWVVEKYDQVESYMYKIYTRICDLFLEEYGNEGYSDNEHEQNEYIRKLKLVMGPLNDKWMTGIRRHWLNCVRIII